MVKNIFVNDEIVTDNINIKSQNEEKKNQLIDEIKSTLLSESPFKEIKVDIGENVSDSKGPQPTAQQGPSTISGIKHISYDSDFLAMSSNPYSVAISFIRGFLNSPSGKRVLDKLS